ncbi:MAG: hypothetical protein A3H28_08010 [Acidobacteria bacterium RIFCSPLOWO2_02_FULL_61_28]|nr:MAG: hypothetical protein A3H28_08010 [Acidobacteria bacterium RIFCSPLOWO2_02_FULL_61_28]
MAATVALYAPVRHFEFVTWDDPNYITENPHVQGGLTWASVLWALTTSDPPYWHPLTWLSHMLDVQVFGLNAGGHHLPNVLLHIGNAILLFGLLHWMTGALGRSAFVAGLFAFHPLHVESVAWVSERKDVLSTLFGMLTLWAYVSYARQPRRGRYLVVLLLFALGLMTKPMLVTLPFMLLLLDVWPLGRVRFDFAHHRSLRSGPGGGSVWAALRGQRSVVLRLVREKLPLLVLAVASSLVTFVIQEQVGAFGELGVRPWDLRLQNAVVSYLAYIGTMLWPEGLAAFYPYPQSLPAWQVVGSILVLIGVSVAVIRAARRHPYLPVGWLWYLGTMIPVIGLIQAGDQALADRFTYVPLIGLFIMVAWGIPELLARWPYRSIALPAAAGLTLLACAISSWNQVQYWKSSLTLWTRALDVTTGNYRAHHNLGLALAISGKGDEAIPYFSEAVRFKPDFAEAHNNLGSVLANQGKLDQAIVHFSEALRFKPDSAEAHYRLGLALARLGKGDQAIPHFSDAIRLQPDHAEAHYGLASALDDQGKIKEAIAEYTEAVRIRPDFAMAHNNLGVALANEGRVDEAIREFSEALRIQPNFADARNNLATMLERKKERD